MLFRTPGFQAQVLKVVHCPSLPALDTLTLSYCVHVNSLAPLAACPNLGTLDLEGFGREVGELGRRMEAGQGEEDLAHLNKLCRWSAISPELLTRFVYC